MSLRLRRSSPPAISSASVSGPPPIPATGSCRTRPGDAAVASQSEPSKPLAPSPPNLFLLSLSSAPLLQPPPAADHQLEHPHHSVSSLSAKPVVRAPRTHLPVLLHLSFPRESNLMSLLWKHIDPRKPNRQRKLLERTHQKLGRSTSRQVQQILVFNELLSHLTSYAETYRRFQTNSTRLHRCLIRWDRLKSKDYDFTRKSVMLSLDLQNFIQEMTEYFLHLDEHGRRGRDVSEDEDHFEGDTTNQNLDPILTPSTATAVTMAGSATQSSSFIEVDHPDRTAGDEQERGVRRVRRSSTNMDIDSLGFRKSLKIKFRLSQLRFKTKSFNHQFESHERKKLDLKFKGNRCIYEMVRDGKLLLEINERLHDLVFDLSLLRK